MYVAPGYTDSHWKSLNLNNDTSADWESAIKILRARIEGRYLDPADMLIAAEEEIRPAKNRRFGFTVLAIDCLLIETFQAFIEGLENTNGNSNRCSWTFSQPDLIFPALQ
jgi:hypothetical protein